jgi:P4 family phage/plasmid primase-like protien
MEKNNSKNKFLDSFPDHVYRYIDQTGLEPTRPPVSSATRKDELNVDGYESYFTVNGFKGAPDAKKDRCTSLNAFFIDIDGRKDLAELEEIKKKLEPTFITETKNGYHCYWLLDEPIYKDEVFGQPTWPEIVARWERIEQSIVSHLKADPVVKDLTRILRVPETYYWKKSGDAYKKGVKNAPFKIKGVHKNLAKTYTMDQMEEAFPPLIVEGVFPTTPAGASLKKFAEAEKKNFFDRVNEKYPIEQRPSFQKLISGQPESLPPNIKSRNEALLIASTLMRQAEWSKEKALKHITEVGWHGIEKEGGGMQEIMNTINSAYSSGYTYSYKNPIIAWNMTPEEQQKIQNAYTAVAKDRKEIDKTRFSNYEYEIASRYPYLKKNEIGIIFNYVDGVYKMMNDQDLSNLVLSALYEDMLWGYRTTKHVKDKVACLCSIIPDLEITDDKGVYFNVKNGILNLMTRELKPHTPDFVSLVQSPVEYDPKATCPTWMACLDAWMAGPEENQKKEMLQQFSGYLLSSSMVYAKALFLVGDGGNGKSTFADTIGMVIGHEGTSRIDLEDLYSMFGLKGLIGKRLNIIEEVSGNYYQSHKLKKLVSGEELTINMKFKDQFKFKPQAKFIFAVNTMPRVDDSSTATERRIIVVQFNNNFREHPDTTLRFAGGVLSKELPGILNWMLDGVDALREKKKFTETIEQRNALLEYREENSSVEGFIGECLQFGEGKTVNSRELYTEYKEYCAKDGRKFKGMIAFIKEVRSYAKRYGKFQYIDRENGHTPSRFEGVDIDRSWSEQSSFTRNRLDNEF